MNESSFKLEHFHILETKEKNIPIWFHFTQPVNIFRYETFLKTKIHDLSSSCKNNLLCAFLF